MAGWCVAGWCVRAVRLALVHRVSCAPRMRTSPCPAESDLAVTDGISAAINDTMAYSENPNAAVGRGGRAVVTAVAAAAAVLLVLV